MPDVVTLLPFLRGWERVSVDASPTTPPKVVQPNDEIELLFPRVISRGWIYGASFMMDNPHLVVTLEYDGSKLSTTPFGLNEFGLTRPMNMGFWLGRYQTGTPPVSVCVFTPSTPMPFQQELRVFVMNPRLTPHRTANVVANILNYTLAAIEVVDEWAFRQSFREILIGKTVEEIKGVKSKQEEKTEASQ